MFLAPGCFKVASHDKKKSSNAADASTDMFPAERVAQWNMNMYTLETS
jgi:hypothetical protein